MDDLDVNVDGAKNVGINAFVFKDLKDGYKKLEEYLKGE